MTRFASAAEAYRDWAGTFDSSGSPILALESRRLSPILDSLPRSLVLDIGCGTGRWLAWLRARGHIAVGFDSSIEMLREATRKPGLAEVVAAADARRLPLRAASADVVLCCLTLAHLQPVSGALTQLASLVRAGGQLIVTDFHPNAIRHGWKRTFRHGGELVEIESQPYSLNALSVPGLQLESLVEPSFGEPERGLFEAAGKSESFTAACRHPAIYIASFRRSPQ